VSGRVKIHDPALLFRATRLAVPLHDVDAFHRDATRLAIHADHLSFLAFVVAAHHADGIARRDVELHALEVVFVALAVHRARAIAFAILENSHLQNLRRERNDLHVPLLAQLARDRPEDARRARLTL